MREWFNRLEKQTEFSNSKVCAHHYIGFLRRGREKYIEVVGGNSFPFATLIHVLKAYARVLWVSFVFRGRREQCLDAFGISGCNLVQSPGTLIFPHRCQCLFTGLHGARPPPRPARRSSPPLQGDPRSSGLLGAVAVLPGRAGLRSSPAL